MDPMSLNYKTYKHGYAWQRKAIVGDSFFLNLLSSTISASFDGHAFLKIITLSHSEPLGSAPVRPGYFDRR